MQVDGEAWAQPPCTIVFKQLPDSAVLLQGPDKVAFSKIPSKKELSLLHTVSSSGINFSDGLSTRRSMGPPPGPIILEERDTTNSGNVTPPTEGKEDPPTATEES